jgi:hypothetical protein
MKERSTAWPVANTILVGAGVVPSRCSDTNDLSVEIGSLGGKSHYRCRWLREAQPLLRRLRGNNDGKVKDAVCGEH